MNGETSDKVMDSATQMTDDTADSRELLREREYPFYKPAEGVGSSVKSEVITNKQPSTIQTPSYFPPFGSNRAGHAHGNDAETAAATSTAASSTVNSNLSTPNGVGGSNGLPPSTAGLATPSTNFGYSPYVQDTPSSVGISGDAVVSPDWLPSPVVEEREDQLSPATSRAGTNLNSSDAVNANSLDAHMDSLALEGIQVVPSASTAAAPAGASAFAASKPVEANSTVQKEPSAVRDAKVISAVASTAPSAAATNPSTTAPSAISSPAAHSSAAAPVRPAAPEHKKSVFGKLFSHGHKEKDKHANDHHSTTSSANVSPHPTPAHDNRPGLAGRASGINGGESDSHPQPGHITRQPSTAASSIKDKEHHSSISNFLHRKGSNKKMPQPDPSLIAMAKNSNANKGSAISTAATTPDASITTLPATAFPGISSTAASRGSTPDVNGLPPPPMSGRGVSASPSRGAGTPTPVEQAGTGGGGRPMARRPSGSTLGHSDAEGGRKQGYNGTYTPTGEQHQVKEKSLKEHLAALGSSTGGMMGKMTRKTSQTSKRSDDGRSEKSVGGGGYYQEEDITTAGGGGGSSAHPVMPSQPKRAPSQSGQSNASTSLLQKYGVCEKVAIGKGATAVVRLAHKWDRSTEKLYAVKEFRKRRKNESEKEYVKKLTSEFCISSTLHHINVVETVDLVQNEEKHWCEVMEYCPGGDLYAAIKKGTMTTGEINIYFKQIVTGVAYLHSMGVAHRDIKPENLLLDNQGHVKITDFGVSDVFRMCWEKQTHMSKGLCGSEPYIAPEQFEQKEYDARLVDVWACAVVFYCMQAQELPWRVAKSSDPSFASYLQYYPNSSTPPPLGNLHPKECRAVIKKMLDPNPKTRIGMEAVLADPFLKGIDYDAPASAPTPLM